MGLLRHTKSTGSKTATLISSSTRTARPSMDFRKSTGLGVPTSAHRSALWPNLYFDYTKQSDMPSIPSLLGCSVLTVVIMYIRQSSCLTASANWRHVLATRFARLESLKWVGFFIGWMKGHGGHSCEYSAAPNSQ